MPFDAAKLPAAVVTLRRDVVVEGPFPPTFRVAAAAQHLCKGPALSAYTVRSGVFYVPELLAGDLADGRRLASWLDCGVAALAASGAGLHSAAVRVADVRAPVEVRLIPADDLPLPPFFGASAAPIDGLERVRCVSIKAGHCDDHAQAVAHVARLGVTAVGDLAALKALGAEPAADAAATRRREVFARLAQRLDGDVSISAEEHPFVMLLDAADPVAHETREALRVALQNGSAIVGESVPSNYVGTARVVFDLDSAEHATAVDGALRAHLAAQQQMKGGEPPPELLERLLADLVRKGLGSARVEHSGTEVVLSLELDPAPAPPPLAQVEADRGPKLAALSRILELAAAGSAPAADDVRALGGDALVRALDARRTAPPAGPPSDAEPLSGFDVLVPRGGARSSAGFATKLVYRRGGSEVADQLLALLVQKGYTVHPLYLGRLGPAFIATRGADRLTLRFQRRDAAADLEVYLEGTSTGGW
jgi:predicted RecA/RadA family phage recombinase